MSDHPENAHAKRTGVGGRYYDDEAVAVVDGREPGGLFEREPIRMSEYAVAPDNDRAQYYLKPAFADRFEVVAGREKLQFKGLYVCDLDKTDFINVITL